jgi:hypothetical protein
LQARGTWLDKTCASDASDAGFAVNNNKDGSDLTAIDAPSKWGRIALWQHGFPYLWTHYTQNTILG